MPIDITNISLTGIISEFYYNHSVAIIEQLGYIKNNSLSTKYLIVYVDERIKQVFVILPGHHLDKMKQMNLIEIINNMHILQNELNIIKDRINDYEKCIEEVIKNYTDYNIIFTGNSIGGYIINNKLKDTPYICYTYNSCFVNQTQSSNIFNYRIDNDLLSIGLLGNKTETIKTDFIDYLIKNKFNIINYLIDSHTTTIISLYPEKCINIPIPFYKS